jgi:hypothetical protein
MKRIFLLIAIISLAGCAGTYKTTFDHQARPEPISIHVVPTVPKEEMDVQIVVSDSSAATAQYGLIGALVGAVIDSAVNKKNAVAAERKAEIIREATAEYDLFHAAHQSTLRVGDHERWKILTIEKPFTTVGWDDAANNAFDQGDSDAVVVLNFDYALTPAATQVRVDVDQRVYLRNTPKKSGKNRKPESLRSFIYFSPLVPLNIRSYEDGEKVRIVEAISDDYAERITAHPQEKSDLEKAMEKELEEIEGSDQIPEVLAIREAWTNDLVARYLDQSIDHVAWMLRHDWEAATVPEEEQRTEQSYVVVHDNGWTGQDKGDDVVVLDNNTIYRSQWGNMYSVPSPLQGEEQ